MTQFPVTFVYVLMNLNYKRRKAVCECGRGFTKNAPNHKRCDVCRRLHIESLSKSGKATAEKTKTSVQGIPARDLSD